MSRRSSASVLSTRTLLVCAAIAVATGVISAVAGWISAPLIGVAPMLYGGIALCAHLIPGVLAQDVLRQPWVALITHLLAALIATALNPLFVMSYLLAVVLMGGIQEIWALLGRYRRWNAAWLISGGGVLGAVLGLTAGLIIGLKYLPPWGAVLSVVLTILGGMAWSALSIAAGNGLRRAGVAAAPRG